MDLTRRRGVASARCTVASVLVLAVALPMGCDGAPGEAPLPPGIWLAGRADALRAVATDLARLDGTPLAAGAKAWSSATAGCTHVLAHAEDGDPAALATAARCVEPADWPAAVRRRIGAGEFVFGLAQPGDAGVARLAGSGRRRPDGGVELKLDLSGRTDTPLARLLTPGPEPPGPPLLAGRDVLIHARLRPEGGLRLADAVSAGGQADRLFRLKSRIFEGAALEGAWEVGVYPPPEPGAPPALALALDARSLSLVEQGMREFVAELERTWPLSHAEARIAGWPGACFDDLRILPGFAPCYVVTERALVLGWDARSVARALSDAPDDELGPDGGLIVHLDRLPAADARLAHDAAGLEPRVLPADYVWDRLSVRGRPLEDGVRIELDLVSATSAMGERAADAEARTGGEG